MTPFAAGAATASARPAATPTVPGGIRTGRIGTILVVAFLVGMLAALPATGSAAAANLPAPAGALVLDLESMGPRVVTSDGPTVLSVAATVSNEGTVAVDELQVRVQRSDPLRSAGTVRDALDGAVGADAVAPEFTALPGTLEPGASMPVRIAVALQGEPAGGGLGLSATGVHEILVNINGVPAGGARARLAAVRFLLPVLSLPAGASSDLRTQPPPPVTVLYPIAAPPRRLPGVPGEPALLVDDSLADSFAPGGRLAGLVAALREQAPPDSAARAAVCVAVDPDLVETAAEMRTGYQVRRPDGSLVDGAGAAAAGVWLDDLAAATRGGCLLALPYADADLVALRRGGQADLARSAVVDGRTILAETLDTEVLTDITWPADGVLDEATLNDVVAPAGSSILLAADGTDGAAGAGPVPVAGTDQVAILADPLLSSAATPARPGDATVAGTSVTGTGAPLGTQDLIGALAYRALAGDGSAVTVAPPHQWAAEGVGATALLAALGRLVDDDLMVPRPLGPVVTTGARSGTDPVTLVYPLTAGGREVPLAVITRVGAAVGQIEDLRSAAVTGAAAGAAPTAVFDPLRRSTLRAASAAWRGDPERAALVADGIADRVEQLRATVRVLEPPSPLALGSSDAPLQLTVANGLPVTMRVLVELDSSTGLRVAPIPALEVPPQGRRQIQVSAEVTRAGQFTVLARVTTPAGGSLGAPSRLRVRSTDYGTITVWLTGTAGVLLIVLAARRILRRAAGERRAGPGTVRPGPGTPDPTDPPTQPSSGHPAAGVSHQSRGHPAPRYPPPAGPRAGQHRGLSRHDGDLPRSFLPRYPRRGGDPVNQHRGRRDGPPEPDQPDPRRTP